MFARALVRECTCNVYEQTNDCMLVHVYARVHAMYMTERMRERENERLKE